MESSGNKKRKIISHDDGDYGYDDDEEEKMEKFYALVKSIREARDRLIMNNKEATAAAADDQSKSKKRPKQEVVAWKPSFQREDFMDKDEAEVKKLPAVSFATTISPSPQYQSKDQGTDHHVNQEQIREDVKEALDLSLSL